MSAIIEYMWIKFFLDENGEEKFIPQFLEDGTQQFWTETANIKPFKLMLVPLNHKIAENMVKKHIPAISVPLPTYTFMLTPEDTVSAYWDSEITITSHFECNTCGAAWLHTDGSKWAQCPRCGESDTWSCSLCGRENIDNKLVKKNSRGETNCPYCTEPHGLNRREHVTLIQDVIENTDYVVLIENKIKMTIRSNNIQVESL